MSLHANGKGYWKIIQDPRKNPDPLQMLIGLSIPHIKHSSLKLSSKSVHNFLRYIALRRTHRRTDRYENTISLVKKLTKSKFRGSHVYIFARISVWFSKFHYRCSDFVFWGNDVVYPQPVKMCCSSSQRVSFSWEIWSKLELLRKSKPLKQKSKVVVFK